MNVLLQSGATGPTMLLIQDERPKIFQVYRMSSGIRSFPSLSETTTLPNLLRLKAAE